MSHLHDVLRATDLSATDILILTVQDLLKNIAYVSLFLYCFHRFLSFLGFSILPVFKILWNWFVWLIPSKIVFALNPAASMAQSLNEDEPSSSDESGQHDVKSDVLWNVLKLDSAKDFLGKAVFDGHPPGLRNVNFSCFQNSVIQALASMSHLQSFLDNLRDKYGTLDEESTLRTLEKFIIQLNTSTSERNTLSVPRKLRSMNVWQQQDAQEYFSKLCDALERDVSRGIEERTAASSPSLLDAIPSSENTDVKNKQNVAKEHGALQYPLEGHLAQRVGCTKCHHSDGLTLIPFNGFTLPLPLAPSCELYQCLDKYTDLEYIQDVNCPKCTLLWHKERLTHALAEISTKNDNHDSQVRCSESDAALELKLMAINQALQDEDFSDETVSEKCGISKSEWAQSTKSKQVMIMRPPNCLAIHLDRSRFNVYTGSLEKNITAVGYPTSFVLNPWIVGCGSQVSDPTHSSYEQWQMNPSECMTAGDTHETTSAHYELRAVIVHSGNLDNGHYVCYRKKPSSYIPGHTSSQFQELSTQDLWWKFDDAKVSQVSEEVAASQGGVYLLFYELVDVDTLNACKLPEEDASQEILASGEVDLISVESENLDIAATTDIDQLSNSSSEAINVQESSGRRTKRHASHSLSESEASVEVQMATQESTNSTPTKQRSPKRASKESVDTIFSTHPVSPPRMQTAKDGEGLSEDITSFNQNQMVATR